jgi:hypothetical protein
MDIQNKKILEALKMQPLSEEEMAARHILGRLYGPIATCIESTRNGRLYNKPLWEKALEDEIFLEKVATKALFLELGHPADREETDMKQACACIPEVPKIVGDDLYAYVDILDTPNGRLLKTLVDYGFVPGISSRGSGDVMDNNQVDPETFFLETWDIVQLPAVKKARLNVCESLASNGIKLKKALAESYKSAKEEDKDTMKKALENLNINIDDELNTDYYIDENGFERDPEDDVTLLEATEDEETDEAADTVEEPAEEAAEEPASDEEEAEDDEAEPDTDEDESKPEDDTEDTEQIEVAEDQMPEVNTVGDAVEMLQEYDPEMNIAFEPIEVAGQEISIDRLSHRVDDEDKDNPILVIGVGCEESDLDALETDEADEDIEFETEDDEAETAEDADNEDEEASEVEETEESEESAEDNGDDEVIESLKEMIRQKEALENEVSDLRKAKAVGDAKEQELQEKLTRYQRAFKQSSLEAAKIPELQAQVREITEQLTQSKKTIKTLTEKVNKAQQLKESLQRESKSSEKSLKESVSRLTNENRTLEAKLEGQTKQFNAKLQERTNLAKTYKARFLETLNRYVESKASMLSIKPSEITSRLNENYTLADVDAVCDQILESTVNFGRLPFGSRAKTSARITESVSKPRLADPEYGYEVDDSLLELAGLKK